LQDLPQVQQILDYGCGDGFTGELVQAALGAPYLAGVDINFSPEALGRNDGAAAVHERFRSEADLGARRFDLILACDVIEHVQDDRALLRTLVERRARPDTHVLITVPAYQILFSSHDRALRHFRRYTLDELASAVTEAGLVGIQGGYLFSTLLLPRALTKLAESIKKQRAATGDDFGAGRWGRGQATTRLISWLLTTENNLLLAAARRRLILPGLTAWILCKTPS
jgi:SAM-dependent methyltransferase